MKCGLGFGGLGVSGLGFGGLGFKGLELTGNLACKPHGLQPANFVRELNYTKSAPYRMLFYAYSPP